MKSFKTTCEDDNATSHTTTETAEMQMVWYGMVWYGIEEFNVQLDTVCKKIMILLCCT